MKGFAFYVLTFLLLAALVLLIPVTSADVPALVRRTGALLWVGASVLFMGGAVVAGILLSAPYLGLLVGMIATGAWVCGTVFYQSPEPSEGPAEQEAQEQVVS